MRKMACPACQPSKRSVKLSKKATKAAMRHVRAGTLPKPKKPSPKKPSPKKPSAKKAKPCRCNGDMPKPQAILNQATAATVSRLR